MDYQNHAGFLYYDDNNDDIKIVDKSDDDNAYDIMI